MAEEKKPEPVGENQPAAALNVEALKQKIREAGPEGGYVPPHGVKTEMTPETLKAVAQWDVTAVLEKTHDVPTSHAPQAKKAETKVSHSSEAAAEPPKKKAH